MSLTPAHPSVIYALDKRCAEVCRQMSINGFAFDSARAAGFSSKLRELEEIATAKCAEAAGYAFNPFSYKQLAKVLFAELGAPVYAKSEITGMPKMGVEEMRGYAGCRDARLRQLALAVLDARRARKVRSTYIDRIIVEDDGRVHCSWLNYGTVSGRWSSQGPNLMNLPRKAHDPTASDGGIRSLYHAAKGNILIAFDCSQLEMRVAAYASGDPAMIAACESGDLHAANAGMIFADEFHNAPPAQKKALRDLAKTSGFAVAYGAAADTVFAKLQSEGVQVQLRAVDAMLRKMRQGFAHYYKWSAHNYNETVRTAVIASPILGRSRWLGHDPPPNEVANFPIQSGGADHMNLRLLELAPLLPREAKLVAQVHDSVTIEAPATMANDIAALCRKVFEAPQRFASSGRELFAVLPIDIKIEERWS